MTSSVKPEVELFLHANKCLEFFENSKQDNAFPEAYLGARYFFKFPNSIILSYISESEFYLYSSDNSLDLNLKEEDWAYISEAGSWKSKETITAEYLFEIISESTQSWGKPLLVLPWAEWTGRYGPLSEEWSDLEETLESQGDLDELEDFRSAKVSQEFIEKISNSDPKTYIFEVDHLFESGDVLLPLDSQYARFRRYCAELENRGWIIIDYMTDYSFAQERLEEEREEREASQIAPAIVSPLEYVFQSYSPSGVLDEWIGTIDLGDGDLADLDCAEQFGLKVEIRHEDQLTILPD